MAEMVCEQRWVSVLARRGDAFCIQAAVCMDWGGSEMFRNVFRTLVQEFVAISQNLIQEIPSLEPGFLKTVHAHCLPQ
jgi:hypothetical protein